MLRSRLRISILSAAVLAFSGLTAFAQIDAETRQLSHAIFKQLIEINTTDSVGSTTVAAEAMAQRLRDAGFAPAEVVVLGPNPRKGNMVARLHGSGAQPARASDWPSGRRYRYLKTLTSHP